MWQSLLKLFFAAIIFLSLIISINTVQAQFMPEQQGPLVSWQSLIQAQCQTNPCIEGMPIAWQVTIGNPNNRSFNVNAVTLKSVEGIVVAAANQLDESVAPLKTKSLNLQSFVPPATKSTTLYYNACFTIEGQENCEQQQRSMIVWPLAQVECVGNEVCLANEQCRNFKCKELECNNINNHTCAETASFYGLPSKENSILVLLVLAVILLILILFFIVKRQNKK